MRQRIYFFALLILIVFHSINTYIWLRLDTRPIHIESTPQLNPAIMAYQKLVRGRWNYSNFLETFSGYPPLYALSATRFYSLFGLNDDWAIMSNIIYIGILIISTYGIAYLISAKRNIAFLSAFIASCLPISVSFYRQFYVDLAVMSMVALNFYFFLKSRFFQDRLFSILYGLSGGLVALVKFTAIPYLLIPYIFTLFSKFNSVFLKHRRSIENEKIFKISNFLISILITISIASVWYLPRFLGVFMQYVHQSQRSGWGILELDGFIYYLLVLVIYQLGPFLSIIFVGILSSLLISKRMSLMQGKGFLWLWIVFPLIFFSLFIPIRNACLTASFLPAISIVIADHLLKLRIRFLRQITVLLIILISAFYSMAYFLKFKEVSISLPHRLNRIGGSEIMPITNIVLLPSGEEIFYSHLRLKKEYWKLNEIVETIKEDALRTKILPKVLNIFEGDYFGVAHFWHYAGLKAMPMTCFTSLYYTFFMPGEPPPSLSNFDYIIDVKEIIPGDIKEDKFSSQFMYVIEEIKNNSGDFRKQFLPLAEFNLPHSLTCIIYRNNNLERLNRN